MTRKILVLFLSLSFLVSCAETSRENKVFPQGKWQAVNTPGFAVRSAASVSPWIPEE